MTKTMIAAGAALLMFVTGVAAAEAEKDLGEKVYKQVCAFCHDSGRKGAPTLDNKAAWQRRNLADTERMTASVVRGMGQMPPRAGDPRLTDAEIRASLIYMLEKNR